MKIKIHFILNTSPINSALEVIHKTKTILNCLLPDINTTQTPLVLFSTQDTAQAPTSPTGELFVELGLKLRKISL